MSDLFGPGISGPDVERAVERTLKYWLETYLQRREIVLGLERGSVARPRSWRAVTFFDDQNPEDQTPLIAIVSPGMTGRPTMEGDGMLSAWWEIGVGVVAGARDSEGAHRVTREVYGVAIRQILLQKASLREWPDGPEFSRGTMLTDESYDDLIHTSERSLSVTQVHFAVQVPDIMSRFNGPTTPADPVTQPGASRGQVQSVEMHIEDLDED